MYIGLYKTPNKALSCLKKIKLMKLALIHSFYHTKSDSIKILVRKLLNVGSNQSVSQSKL